MYELLKELCRERGTTISKLCTVVTGNSANLATWKKGYMRSDYLSKCADVLGVSADYLLQRASEFSEADQKIQAETNQLSENQKADVLKYIEFIKTKE